MKKDKPLPLISVITILGFILSAVFFVWGFLSGTMASAENMKSFVERAGIFAPLFFLTIQFMQVLIPLVPGGVTNLVGVMMFGPLYGFILNYTGMTAGAIVAFILARRFGRPLLFKLFSREQIEKYDRHTGESNKFYFFFCLFIFLPGFPDDFLCYLAGTTDIEPKKFLFPVIFLKPFSILAYSLLESGIWQGIEFLKGFI